jgi:hypothetical protein
MMKWLPIFVLVMAGSANAQAPGISMQMETETKALQFRIGEPVGIQLTFANSTADMWMVSIVGRDRSVLGLQTDGFVVSPSEGTSDPMRYRFGQGIVYSGPGGIFLHDKTAVAKVDLNQWIRFERLGFYRVHARFHARKQGQDVVLESNDIGIEIVAPDAEWQAQQLREAVNILETTKQDNQTFETIMNAARQIGYLDTPNAILEAGRLLGTAQIQVAQILKNGLLASAHRNDVATALRKLLRNPDQAISPIFLEALAALEARDVRNFGSELSEVVGQKREAAKAISTKTLVDLMPEGSLRTETAQLFSQLPENQQSELLGWQWPKIAGPDMIPVLRAIYDAVPPSPLAATAVERLYELAPAQAREIILDEIGRPVPRLPFKTLAILPDATLPGMGKVLAENLQQNQGTEELIARYATASILEPVKAYYAKRDSTMRARGEVSSRACDPPLMAYFLRTDPVWGERALRDVLADQSYPLGRCWMGVLGQTANYFYSSVSPEWEKIAAAALMDSPVVVKGDAVKALSQHGSVASEAAVWDAFRYWHEWWKDRPELNEESRRLEQVFLESFAHTKNWNISADDLGKVRDLCITQDCSRRAEEYRREWRP